jgi:gamma-glutamyl-gamma-aminobutyrate hydrolase PuuD
MIGAILGNMKMYRYLETDIPKHTVHKPREETDVRVHQISLIKDTPIFDIMDITKEEKTIFINSRHNQSMVHPALQDYVKGEPIVKMDLYAVSTADGIPEIWGNEEKGILCVQGHPEDLASKGNIKMQNIYNYIANQAKKYKKSKVIPQINKVNLIEK